MEKSLTDIKENYKEIKENINNTAIKAGINPSDISLVAATKTVPTYKVNQAIDAGIKIIGESRVQELLSKYNDYNLDSSSIHFIGNLQTNKVRQIIGKVGLIQSVDSVRLANQISNRSINEDLVTDILIQVNIGKEKSKGGVNPSELEELIHEISDFKGLKVKGLMCIPPILEGKVEDYKYFSKMHNLFVDISSKKIDNISMDFLSMGMSNDYCEAILEGANMVRIGSSLFGERNYNK